MDRSESVLTIEWTIEDIIEAMQEEEVPVTDDNLKKVINERNIRNIEEASIERGWDAIRAIVRDELTHNELRPRKRIHVVAAIIERRHTDNAVKVFATQRGYGQYKDWWEFPGGKVESRETPEEALIREIREELSAEINIKEFLMNVEYDYPEFHLSMDCYICELATDHIDLLEHEDAKWLSVSDIDTVDWLPADIEVVNALKKRF